MTRINADNKNKLSSVLVNAKDLNVDNFVIVDSADKIKSFGYDEWYKTGVDQSQGIWLGNGIADQYVLKLLSVPRQLRDEIPENFGYIVKNGKTTLVKLIEK